MAVNLQAENKRLKAELAMINKEYRDCPESELTRDALVVKCRALEAQNARLQASRDAAVLFAKLMYFGDQEICIGSQFTEGGASSVRVEGTPTKAAQVRPKPVCLHFPQHWIATGGGK